MSSVSKNGLSRFAADVSHCPTSGRGSMTVTFSYEHEMLEPAVRWLQGQDLMVKKEFPTPWGICDLVGCSLNKNRIRQRLKLRQAKPIRSQLRVHLLSLIPDEEDGSAIDAETLHAHFGDYLNRSHIEVELDRLVRDRFIEESSPGTYCKRNGWMPLHKRLLAVELKLTRVEDALHQAINNLGFADESYIGLPATVATRLVNSKRITGMEKEGVGILAVEPHGCRAILKATKRKTRSDESAQRYSVERFWHAYVRDNGA